VDIKKATGEQTAQGAQAQTTQRRGPQAQTTQRRGHRAPGEHTAQGLSGLVVGLIVASTGAWVEPLGSACAVVLSRPKAEDFRAAVDTDANIQAQIRPTCGRTWRPTPSSSPQSGLRRATWCTSTDFAAWDELTILHCWLLLGCQLRCPFLSPPMPPLA